MKVFHIIIGLEVGGAELMLKRLIESHQDDLNYSHSVISLTKIGKVGDQLRDVGVSVRALNSEYWFAAPYVLWQLTRLLREERPDIVQTWMYHADLLGGIAARLAGNRNLFWGIRGTAIPQSRFSAAQAVVSLCMLISHFLPKMIICCSESARIAHIELGYDATKMTVIPNGYVLSQFSKISTRRKQLRDEFGFTDINLVIGIIGRFDPLKDYLNFVSAAARLASKVENVRFLMVGRNIDSANEVLTSWISETGFAHKFVTLGERSDIPACLDAMDIYCLSSSHEGFPNVVCEAMAMSLPCVVTRAGDAATIVADTGIVVSAGDSIALSNALMTMVEMDIDDRLRLGNLARERIESQYSIGVSSARFEEVYKTVANLHP